MRESKEKIKSRMIRNAAQMWGFQEAQPESSFDPVMDLLLGACAYELEKISREITNTESRILERLVNILTPQPITSPHPAYAVAYGKPSRQNPKVTPEDQFFTEIRVSDQYNTKTEEKQIFFRPTGTFNLNDGKVRYLAANKRINEIVDNQYKDIIAEMNRFPLSPTMLYIGLELPDKPSGLTLFFDVVSEHLKQTFLTDLENCQWKIGGVQILANKGIPDTRHENHNLDHLTDGELNLSSKMSIHINRYFARQFIHFDLTGIDDTVFGESKRIPSLLAQSVDPNELSSLDGNIVWLELQFIHSLSDEIPESLTCSLNCFPVINIKQNEFTGSTRELINIIPLTTPDVFFDLKRVTNTDGELYKINHFEKQADLSRGSAILRVDGVGRFDTRNAMEFLDYLVELMKEESAAFNVIGSDMISSNLRELNQVIARLEKKIELAQIEKGDTAFLMLKPKEGDRQVYVEYWSTNCTFANNIKAGTPLNVYKASDLDYNSSFLVTGTTGGREKPNTEERINTYRRSLLSGNRVVTKEDIRALCFEYFSDYTDKVEVVKGIERGSLRSEGFIRTMDINIYLKQGKELNLADQNALRQKLLVLLERRSSNILPFRVFFR